MRILKIPNYQKMHKYISVLILLASVFCGCTKLSKPHDTINPIIGNSSWIETYGREPDGTENNQLRIQTHLRFVENMLRNKDVSYLSPHEQQKRENMLNLLRDYWQRGEFPINSKYADDIFFSFGLGKIY